MSKHVPDDLMAAFVDGDVDEQVAIHVAEHIDECPACATRAVTLDPMAHAFTGIPDPIPPSDLTAAVLAKLAEPEPSPRAEVAVGLGLLAAAALLALVAGDPVSTAVQLSVLANLVAKAGTAANALIVSSTLALTATMIFGTGSVFAAMRLTTLSAERRLQ